MQSGSSARQGKPGQAGFAHAASARSHLPRLRQKLTWSPAGILRIQRATPHTAASCSLVLCTGHGQHGMLGHHCCTPTGLQDLYHPTLPCQGRCSSMLGGQAG